jgi:nucleoside-diphosphate-sugar epimerase
MKILITGGNGNIAKIINNKLSSEHNITLITRNDFDLLDGLSVSNYLSNREFDILIHTAINGGRRTKEENGEVVFQNLIMFENLMKFADKFKLIINFDSGAIYDRSTDIYCREESELITIPTDYYGFSKYLIYKRSLQYDNMVNFRIFNIFHVNEEPDRFIKACYIAKKNGTNVKIYQDKYFDFMYEDDFIKTINYYINNFKNNLPKTFNLSYTNKYKLSTIAEMILGDKNKIEIFDDSCITNYCGDGTILNNLCINLDGLDVSLKKYEEAL